MSDDERSRSRSRSRSVEEENGMEQLRSPKSERSARQSRDRSQSVERKKSPSKSRSRSRSHHSHRKSRKSRRSHSRSRSRSRSYRRSHRKRSRSRSRSPVYDKHYSSYRRSHSRSPMSSRKRHIGPRDQPAPSRCLGIFGMSTYTDEKVLSHYFSQFGKLENVQIVYDKKTGRSRGFGFIYFESLEDCIRAKEEAAGAEIDGQRIRVDFSITKRPHTPTPGIYMGRPTRRRDDYSPSPYYSRRRSRSYSYSPRR